MIVEPERYVDDFRARGCDRITFHLEATCHAQRLLSHVRSIGAKAGLAICPQTPVAMLEDVIQDCDTVLVMSVNPGFSGQTFIARTFDKVRASSGADRSARHRLRDRGRRRHRRRERARSGCGRRGRAGDGLDDFRRRGSRRGTAPHPLVVAVMAREGAAGTAARRRSGRGDPGDRRPG